MSKNVLFMNGEFVPRERGFISVDTHSFTLGTACLEGIRGYWNKQAQHVYLFRLREHFERLMYSCKILHMTLPYTIDDLIFHTVELVKKNDMREDIYIRVVAYKSELSLNIRLHEVPTGLIMTTMPMGNLIDTTGLKCAVSSWRRIDDNSIPARAKIAGSYVNSTLARSEVLQNGFDEAILLNNEGHVAEASAENIFLIIKREFVTPSITENILPGITRDTVIKIASQELGYHTTQRQVDRTELYTADEIFLCGTGAQIAPVVSVDHRPVGNGQTGPIVEKLQEIYFTIVRGTHPHYQEEWCTPV